MKNNSEIQKKMRLSDVAKELGVSKTTVSRVISGKGRISEKTKEKVLKYIDEHNYKPNAIAKGLAQSKTNNIAVTIPGDYSLADMTFFQNFTFGITKIASLMDYDILNVSIMENDISQLERVIENHKVDGVILTRTLVNDSVEQYLKKHSVPFITIGTSIDSSVVQVDNDHINACCNLTTKLIKKGFKNIALIGGNTEHVVTQSRYKGFLRAFKDTNTKINYDLVYLDTNSEEQLDETIEKLIKQPLDCIICMDDSICAYTMAKLKKEHIKIPEQLKIASFYSSQILKNSAIEVSSIKFDITELGMVSCKTFIDYIDGKNVNTKTLLGYEIFMRESTE